MLQYPSVQVDRKRGRRPGLVAALLTLALFVTATGASAQTGSRQSAELKFAEQLPGATTALTLNIDYVNPNDPNAKPPAVRTVVEQLAAGAQIDTAIPGRCAADDAQLMAQGAGACPTDSRVGSGTVRLDTGFPEPGRFIDADVVFLNNTDQLILVSTERGSGARVVTRAEVRGREIVTNLSILPGTPPDGAAIDVVHFTLDPISRQIGQARRGYITTPAECSDVGHWVNALDFSYADGVSQRVSTNSPCVKGGSRSGPCANNRNGSRGRDRFAGTGEGDRLFGFSGNDRLAGRGGEDCLHGHRGDDSLRGGPGRDLLFGGRGRDTCRGGPGRDRYRGCERTR